MSLVTGSEKYYRILTYREAIKLIGNRLIEMPRRVFKLYKLSTLT